jgi:hypothetical protein
VRLVAEYGPWNYYSNWSMILLPAISSHAIGTEARLPGAKLSIFYLGEGIYLEIV